MKKVKSNKPRKRIYIINRDFQLRYSLAAVVVGVISTAITAVLLLYPLYQFRILRIPQFLPLPILLTMAGAAIANIFMVGFMGIFITHRIAGPMYALVRCFRRIEMGSWAGHLKVRQGDDLRYLVRNFNLMVDGLVDAGRMDLKEIDAIMAALESNAVTPDLIERVKKHRAVIAQRLQETSIQGVLIPGNI